MRPNERAGCSLVRLGDLPSVAVLLVNCPAVEALLKGHHLLGEDVKKLVETVMSDS